MSKKTKQFAKISSTTRKQATINVLCAQEQKDYLTPKDIYKVWDLEKANADDMLVRAYSNRDFAINQYWSISKSFWGIVVLIITACAYMIYAEPAEEILLSFERKSILYGISIVGYSVSFISFVTLSTARYWQENWEKIIELLEEYKGNTLYRLNVGKNSLYLPSSFVNSFFFLGSLWLFVFIACKIYHETDYPLFFIISGIIPTVFWFILNSLHYREEIKIYPRNYEDFASRHKVNGILRTIKQPKTKPWLVDKVKKWTLIIFITISIILFLLNWIIQP